ncbi:hypothetical protein ACFSTE_17195 [Aquimarina hainanensis]|uniref:Outer membrane protein beta-barrel domain-containing protein n=1 Tax=Aquimarina hainanensis TaxID=1578017 RepID=A0ABW5NCK2_9FLAO|nr:hypothetical protein [Aquimarina sp. TRL1]QKX06925.1 hypothetical protein HN014_19040 [Aquimarina sp. TRL1]
MRVILFIIIIFTSIGVNRCWTQQNTSVKKTKIKPFAALELGQAVFNDFKSYSGEIGVKFPNSHMMRVLYMNTTMSEAHLSSDFVIVVDGDHVQGKQVGFETFYDIPVYKKMLYVSPSFGWYTNEYEHTILAERFQKKSATVGVAISYREEDVFGLKGLYYTVSFPMRTPFEPIKKTTLGDTVIKNNTFDNNLFFFVGFQF